MLMKRYVLAAVAVSTVAAACGSSGTTTAGTNTPVTATPTTASPTSTAPSSTTAVATTSAPSTAPSSTTTATTPPRTGISACGAPDFSVALQGPGNGAAGTIYFTVKATNVSGVACSTGGYFGASTYDVAGKVISSNDTRIQQSAVRQFTLAAGGSLTFSVGLSDVPTGAATTCPQVGALHLIPPNDTRYVQLSLLNSAGQGAKIINCSGILPVSPVVAA